MPGPRGGLDKALKCGGCGAKIMHTRHFNAKWCSRCRDERVTRPKSSMTPAQISRAKTLIGKMPREEIAERIGVSVSSLKRAFRGVRLAYHNKWARNPDFVREVCAFYAANGKRASVERYPGVCIRSIVERYPLPSRRQSRWTDEQLIELAQMAGVISLASQAKYFSRPGANRGSIVSVWMKRFGSGGGCINGLAWYMAKHFVDERCPKVKTPFWRRREHDDGGPDRGRILVTWVDLERHLKADAPDWLRESAAAMAKFQRWLHGVKDPKRRIKRIIETRETA